MLISLFLANENLNATANLANTHIETAINLEQQNNPETARKMLSLGFQATKQIDILSQWLAMDETMFLALKKDQKSHSLTHWQTKFENKCLKKWHYGWHCTEDDRQKELSHQKHNAILVLKIEKVRAILYKYDQLKSSLLSMQTILNNHLLVSTDSEFDRLKEILLKQVTLIEEIKRTRYDYLSFDVISPYLARTKQLVFISKIHNPKISSILTLLPEQSLKKLRSAEKLREAATVFAGVAVQDIIFDSNSSVREQFRSVYKKFEEAAGQDKFQEFQVIQKIAYKLNYRKKLEFGAERWWKTR